MHPGRALFVVFVLSAALALSVVPGLSRAEETTEAAPTAEALALSDADRIALAQSALHWAVEGGLSDARRLDEDSALVVARVHLPTEAELEVAGHSVRLLSVREIQEEADSRGDLLYFRFSPFRIRAQRVQVPISLLWAIGAGSTAQYMSGGGATLEFERRDGSWLLLPSPDPWIS